MKFYKRDPDRAIAGMAELTFEQRGAYNSLLDLLYSRDGKVPDDDVRVARMMSCHWRQWRKLKLQLIEAGKVWVEDGYLYANRVQETLKEAADFSQEQRKKAAKRWVKSEKINENNDPVMPPGNALTPIDTPTDIDSKERTDTANPVSTTSPLTEKTIPTHTLPPAEKSANGQVIELKEAKPEKQYAFKGEMFRITVKDYQKWRRSYWAIPDLMAMLEHIDLWYANAEEGKLPKRIFFAVAGWLNNEHQKRKDRGATMPRWLLKEMGKC